MNKAFLIGRLTKDAGKDITKEDEKKQSYIVGGEAEARKNIAKSTMPNLFIF